MSKNQSGFTIIEVVVASFLVLTLSAGILGLQFIIGNTQVQSINSFLTVESGNNAINQIARNLRKARPAESGSFPLITLEDNLLEFYADVDFDDEAEKVTYSLSGTDLLQSTVEPSGAPPVYDDQTASTKTIATGIQNTQSTIPIFFYYNGDWPTDTLNNPLITPASLLETKTIKIALISNSSNDTKEELVLETLINLRTLKDNL